MVEYNLTLKSLVFKNFRSFLGEHSFELSRSPGLYFIAGENQDQPGLGSNDAGKSTLFDALFWTLTGKTLRIARPGDTIVPWNDSNVTTAVLLDFWRNGDHGLIRTRHPNSLKLDGREVVQEDIDKILGVSEVVLRSTLLVGQFSDLFLDLRPEQQSSLFSDLLELDLWLAAAERASDKVKEIDKTIRNVEVDIARLEGQKAELEKQIEETLVLQLEWTKVIDNKKSLLQREKEGCEAGLRGVLKRRSRSPKDLSDKINTGQSEVLIYRQALQEITKDVRTSSSVMAGHEISRKRLQSQLAVYKDSLKGSLRCPECGQEVDKLHIESKISGIKVELSGVVKLIEASPAPRYEREMKIIEEHISDFEKQLDIDRGFQRERELFLVDCDKDETGLKAEMKGINDRLKALEIDPYKDGIEVNREKLRECLDSLEKQNHFKGKLQSEIEIYRYWVGGFRQLRLDIIDEVLLELEISATKNIDQLGLHGWRVSFATERETKSGSIRHSFTTLIYPPYKVDSVPFENYGGGVSTRLRLGVTFGLSEVLLSRAGIVSNIEILDEPGKHLSQDGIDNLLELLRERALTLGRCIYFVDHSSHDLGYFDGVIRIIKDSEGSRIVQ